MSEIMAEPVSDERERLNRIRLYAQDTLDSCHLPRGDASVGNLMSIRDEVVALLARLDSAPAGEAVERLLTDALREWYGGERYARDYEYIDANYSDQMRHLLRYVIARLAPPAEVADTGGPVERLTADNHRLGQFATDMEDKYAASEQRVAELERLVADENVADYVRLIKDKHELQATLSSAREQIAELERLKDGAYEERNKVVAALAKLFPSGLKATDIAGWSTDWHQCVYIDLPTGQVSWHFHDSQATLFEGLPPYAGEWDGHDTDEKYRRLAALPAITQDQT